MLRVEKLDGKESEDFALWQLRVLAVLEGLDLANVTLGLEVAPEDQQAPEFALRVNTLRKARAIIITALGNKPLRVIQ